MLELKNICKTFNPGTINAKTALNDLSLTLADGDFVTVIGGNGAGKSTIMNILTSYLAPSGGEVKVAGFSLPEEAQQAKACVGYRPEQPPLYPEMTVQSGGCSGR